MPWFVPFAMWLQGGDYDTGDSQSNAEGSPSRLARRRHFQSRKIDIVWVQLGPPVAAEWIWIIGYDVCWNWSCAWRRAAAGSGRRGVRRLDGGALGRSRQRADRHSPRRRAIRPLRRRAVAEARGWQAGRLVSDRRSRRHF